MSLSGGLGHGPGAEQGPLGPRRRTSSGYLGQEELTAQRFVADPFTGGVMYRSGDPGRLRPDGRLEHLGRIDRQIKIRDFRIELAEIRSLLLEADVRTAAVVVRRDDPADAATARIDAMWSSPAATPPRSASGPRASCPTTCSPPRSPLWTRSR